MTTTLRQLLHRLLCRHRWNYTARNPGRLSCKDCTATKPVR